MGLPSDLLARFSALPPLKQRMVILSAFGMAVYTINKITQRKIYSNLSTAGHSFDKGLSAKSRSMPSQQISNSKTCPLSTMSSVQGDPDISVANDAKSPSTLIPSNALSRLGLSMKKKGLSAQFRKQLLHLLRIVLPGIRSKECAILLLHSSFLTARAFISIFVANLDGKIVKTLVDRNGRKFMHYLVVWLFVAIPATYINSMIKFLESKLSIAFRTRLVKYAYELYMKNETYYRIGSVDGRIQNADQCLTDDISKFCNFLSHLYSQISKPLLDGILTSYQFYAVAKSGASNSNAKLGTFLLSAFVVFVTARVLRFIQPPFGRFAAAQQRLEGDLRHVHSRLITHSEEVAFYGGERIEQATLMSSYLDLVKHMNFTYQTRILYNLLEGFFMKYIWSACGLIMIAIPIFIDTNSKSSVSARTRDYVTSRQLLMGGSEAIERIMLASKEINELAGYTNNVYGMLSVFEDVQRGHYVKSGVKTKELLPPSSTLITKDLIPSTGEITKDNHNEDDVLVSLHQDIRQKRGKVFEVDYIKFEGVPIVSPNGDVLVGKLNFAIQPGMHLLITGPNGCGKSSLFRILGGLWPVYSGRVYKPALHQMFYIPQRPYLSLGTLRDQIIYPHTVEQFHAKGLNDNDLMDILGWVNLQYVVEREGGWDVKNDWQDVLSGGEKQRIGMTRLFYHKPKYAILDECTSAVSMDVEGKMYQHAIDLDISLITVTHRPSLWKFHTHLLQFDGNGHCSFSELNASVRMTFKEEKSNLEQSLTQLPKMQARLKELCRILGEDSVLLHQVENHASDDKRD